MAKQTNRSVDLPRVLPAADLALLAKYDTPTICNVIELFNVRPRTAGYMDGRIRACFPKMPPMVGYAVTATFRSAEKSRVGNVYNSIVSVVDHFDCVVRSSHTAPTIPVFQDTDDPGAAATFGEVMCSVFKAFGSVGLITSGAGRDLDQVEAINYPVFTDGTICSHGYCHLPTIGESVRVGGVTIHPGDLLHGDRNGVTTIPHEIAAAVAHTTPRLVEAEAVVLNYVRGGKPTKAGLAKAAAEMKRRFDEIAKSVQKTR